MKKLIAYVFIIQTLMILNSCQQKEEGFFLKKSVIKKIYPAIVEVVIPKNEDKDIVYQRPLPFDQLDYKQRNDKFYAIGTAFFIGPKRLISAAHVIPTDNYSTYKEYKIRTSTGEVYEIDKIYRYSTYRDLIEFELKDYPKEIQPLKIQPKVEIGDMVYAVGNAGGEGISTRGGQVSTFTPEPVAGQWDYIRFSSPASPGNSGGPLVNYKGEVVGIIVMKNNSENLNFALPVTEIEKVSLKEANFLSRKLRVQDGMQVLTKDWKFATPLPSDLQGLRQKAIPHKDEFYATLIADFKEQFYPLLFPHNPRFRDSLLYQSLFSRMSRLDKDQALLEWTLNPIPLKKIVVSKENILYHAKGEIFENLILFLSGPKETPQDLLQQPRTLLNRALKASGANRYMAGQRIPIEDHGSPNHTFQWKDRLGRVWYTSQWEVLYSDSLISTHCSPTPEGVYCLLDHTSSEQKFNGHMHFVKENILEINLSYRGNLEQWKNFLAKENRNIIPEVLQGVELTQKKSLILLSFPKGPKLRLNQDESSSEHFRLTTLVSYDPSAPLQSDLQGIEVLFNKNSPEGFTLYQSYEAAEMAPDDVIERWNNIKAKEGLFNQEVHLDGDQNVIFLQLNKGEQESVITSIDQEGVKSKEVEKLWLMSCFSPSTERKSLLKTRCQKQRKSITLQ